MRQTIQPALETAVPTKPLLAMKAQPHQHAGCEPEQDSNPSRNQVNLWRLHVSGQFQSANISIALLAPAVLIDKIIGYIEQSDDLFRNQGSFSSETRFGVWQNQQQARPR